MDFSQWGAGIQSLRDGLIQGISLEKIISTLVWALVLVLAVKIIQSLVLRLVGPRLKDQTRQTLRKSLGWAGTAVVVMVVFDSLGFDLTALLGTAGVVGIALGFAAQTSTSNIVSGFFLLSEKPFSVGDVINSDGVTGVVVSIDMLSVKIKTFDNTFVRIPNETLIKSRVTNVTKYPIRRLDFQVTVSQESDVNQVLEVLKDVIAQNRYSLDNPEPFLMVQELAPSGIVFSLGVWFEKSELLALRNSLLAEIHQRFRKESITIPRPQMEVRIQNSSGLPAS